MSGAWYYYAKGLLLERYREYIRPNARWDIEFEDIENMILGAWDGSEYHSPAHMYMVAATALQIGAWMDLPKEELHAIVIAGLFHDIGRRAIDDNDNIKLANWFAQHYIDENVIFVDEFEKRQFKGWVEVGIKGTLFPSTEPITHHIGQILRDADFASLLAPEDVYEEACSALEKESGTRASYDFVVSQKALLPMTVEYYKQHNLEIELIKGD